MPIRIAIVDGRTDLLEFLKEKIEAKGGFKVFAVKTEEEAEAIKPEPDVILVDFEPRVDLSEVFAAIEEGLSARVPAKSRKR